MDVQGLAVAALEAEVLPSVGSVVVDGAVVRSGMAVVVLGWVGRLCSTAKGPGATGSNACVQW